MIPKIIHQIWLGDSSRKPDSWLKSWQLMNPTWQYKLWTDDNLPLLINPSQFQNCPSMAGKADILRYELLYKYGGFYIDADTECIRPLDDDLLDNEAFCSWENEYCVTGMMNNSHLASIRLNPFFLKLVEAIGSLPNMNFDPIDTWWVTGPGLLTRMVSQLCYDRMTIYPSYFFSPRHHSGLLYQGKGRVYSHHYWGSTTKRSANFTKVGFNYV